MKKLLFIIATVLFFESTVISQNFSKEFGEISQAEIDLKFYEKDKTAEALILYDIGTSWFRETDRSFNVVFDRTTRLKILNDAGLNWGEIEIPFYHEGNIYEDVSRIEAYTYNFENGKINKTKLDLSNCKTEKLNEYWSLKKFVMPEVKAGSIIEYKYSINSQYYFNFRDWEFQKNIPTVYSEYVVKMIPFYEYTWLLQGANKFDSHTSYAELGNERHFGEKKYNDMVYKFVMFNIPAFHNEEFTSSVNDYIIKIDFQLSKINFPSGGAVNVMTTWPEMIEEFIKKDDFGKYIKKSEKLALKIMNYDRLINMDADERFDSIINFIKANFNWNNINEKFSSKSPNELLKDKFGNTADINLFAVGMLNAMGIEAFPLLTSTRDNGMIKYDYPFSHFFNYVLILAKIDGQIVLSDATELLCSNKRIPERCINDKGLLIKNDEITWIGLQTNVPSQTITAITIDSLDTNPSAFIKISANEYDALFFRQLFGGNKTSIVEYFDKAEYQIIDSSIRIKNQVDPKKPYLLEYKMDFDIESINGKIYISPFLKSSISDNPLKQNSRSYPIDITFPKKRIYTSTIAIPDGYKTDFVPANYTISNDLFELSYSATHVNNIINLSYGYLFKNAVYSATDYSKIKFYFNEIVKKGNEKVVITKIQ